MDSGFRRNDVTGGVCRALVVRRASFEAPLGGAPQDEGWWRGLICRGEDHPAAVPMTHHSRTPTPSCLGTTGASLEARKGVGRGDSRAE